MTVRPKTVWKIIKVESEEVLDASNVHTKTIMRTKIYLPMAGMIAKEG
jgi:hypothetical protein